MNKLPILAALLAAASTPAWAQRGVAPWPEPVPFGSNYTPRQLIDQLAAQIDRYAREGLVTRADAQHWQAQLAAVRTLERRYRRGGLSGRERIDLVHRTNTIRDQLIAAENRRLGRSMVGRRMLPSQDLPFQDTRRRSLLDANQSRRIDNTFPPVRRPSDNSFYGTDDQQDMNDLRGPAPPKRDEGS